MLGKFRKEQCQYTEKWFRWARESDADSMIQKGGNSIDHLGNKVFTLWI